MAARLTVRELAKSRNMSLSEFHREAKIPMSTARRLWYSSSDGSENGPPLRFISLDVLEQIAVFFDVGVGDLFEPTKAKRSKGK
jgi:transcriptional regulator with XRE-family HTH domain